MAKGFESVSEKVRGLPKQEALWIESRVKSISKMLGEQDNFPDILFDGKPYNEQTAHLRLLQYHRDSIELGFSDTGRQALLDVAMDFGAAAELPDDVIRENWLKASQEKS